MEKCEKCGKVIADDLYFEVNNADGEFVCECVCYDCAEKIAAKHPDYTFIDDEGDVWRVCELCGELFPEGEMEERDGFICSACINELRSRGEIR